MNPATKALLRNAVLEAVNTEQDTAAMELLSLLAQAPPTTEPNHAITAVRPAQLALPSDRVSIDGPPRDYHYWAGFIRDNFMPFMAANGRVGFTSHELFSWLENCPALSMTTGDIKTRSDGHPHWRNMASSALGALKKRGLLKAEPGGRNYLIADPACFLPQPLARFPGQ